MKFDTYRKRKSTRKRTTSERTKILAMTIAIAKTIRKTKKTRNRKGEAKKNDEPFLMYKIKRNTNTSTILCSSIEFN